MKKKRPSLSEIIDTYEIEKGRDSTAAALRKQGFKFKDTWFSQQLNAQYGRTRNGPMEPFGMGYIGGHSAEGDIADINEACEDIAREMLEEDDADEIPAGVVESADRRRGTTNAKTLVFTSAQSNTMVHADFLAALEHLCDHRDAELHISQFTYNKAMFGKKSVKPGADTQEGEKLWFDPAIAPYVSDSSLQLTGDLVWCGELNVIPTMKFPLTQFKGYTRHASAIIPHAKMAMESVPTMQGQPCKMLYTTGAVTMRNYVEKTAGQVADFHHVFGAIIVEIDEDGTWWCRQINATNDGSFYDLTTYYDRDGHVGNKRVEALTHGDIHWEKRDNSILDAVFSRGGVVDYLAPREQFFHDTVDFAARNHHNIKDGHFLHKMQVDGTDSVEAEFIEAGYFLSNKAYRSWAHTFIVTSNHDMAVEIWLRNPVAMTDPKNARWWHQLNLYCHEMIASGQKPRPFAYSIRRNLSGEVRTNYTMLHEDDSYLILDKIEAGLHGHLGPNGARGAPKNLRTVGRANTGHTHTAGIVEGVFTAGLYALLDMGYNKGLSSWSHSLIATYPNAKRAILTIKKGKAWR